MLFIDLLIFNLSILFNFQGLESLALERKAAFAKAKRRCQPIQLLCSHYIEKYRDNPDFK